MADRGLAVDHSSVHRWVVKLLPLFEKAFRRHKRPVGTSLADGSPKYAANGNTFTGQSTRRVTPSTFCCEPTDKAAARCYFEKAIAQNGGAAFAQVPLSQQSLSTPSSGNLGARGRLRQYEPIAAERLRVV
jgi:putative transposase